MKDYLKVGDWIQKEKGGPWTEIVKEETGSTFAVDTNDNSFGIYYNTYKILRKAQFTFRKAT